MSTHTRAGRWIRAGMTAVLAGWMASAATAQSAGEIAGAGAAPFPAGTTFSLVAVHGMQFGLGAAMTVPSLGTGDFHATLLGTSALGGAQPIEFDGGVTGVSIVQGAAVLSGTGVLDMGDGTVPRVGVPFTATATANTLLLVLGGATLPQATLTQGAITIR
jgi:hypothetical protein